MAILEIRFSPPFSLLLLLVVVVAQVLRGHHGCEFFNREMIYSQSNMSIDLLF